VTARTGADFEMAYIAAVLLLAGVGLFAIVGFTGIPALPNRTLKLLNTVAMLRAAVWLLFAVMSPLWIHRSSPQLISDGLGRGLRLARNSWRYEHLLRLRARQPREIPLPT